MTLLDLLVKQAESSKPKAQSSGSGLTANGLRLIVAHFNHGIRDDSHEDEQLVAQAARQYGLQFEVGHGHLGPRTGEDKARQARYGFLREVKDKYQAEAIITAHHQDDLLETVVINLLRGTGARGLHPLRVRVDLIRPLLDVSRKQIIDYAKKHHIKWREDPTNQDLTLLRNYIRHQLLLKLNTQERQQLLQNIDKIAKIDDQTHVLIAKLSQNIVKDQEINRQRFIQLPIEVGDELILHWLRQQKAPDPDRPTIRRLNLALRTAGVGTKHSVRKGLWLEIDQQRGHFTTGVV